MNIACWSGPRNLSTAMMYSFGARADCGVWDEPYYAAYLAQTGIDHPMRAESVAGGETDRETVDRLCGQGDPGGQTHFYQKHMTHHMIWGDEHSWFADAKHVFLIRHPARVLASYVKKREQPTLDDIGAERQSELYDAILAKGHPSIVIDSYDIRQNPEGMLRALCTALDLPFDEGMLSWPSGGHPQDGAWAPHWYGAVRASTGFAGAETALPQLPPEIQEIADAALPNFERLKAVALTAAEVST